MKEKAMPTQGTKALVKSLSDANAVMMKNSKKRSDTKGKKSAAK